MMQASADTERQTRRVEGFFRLVLVTITCVGLEGFIRLLVGNCLKYLQGFAAIWQG